MAFLLERNDVLSVNPVVGVDEALPVNGSDWLWAVTAIYIVAFVLFLNSLALLRQWDKRRRAAGGKASHCEFVSVPCVFLLLAQVSGPPWHSAW